MRVLHVHSGNLYGGVETLLATLVRERAAWPALAHEFALSFEGRLSDELRAAGARVHALGGARMSRPLSVWRARRALARLVRRVPFDAVVCHSAWSQGLFGGTAREAGLSLALWMHAPADAAHWLERFARRAARPDLIICNSRFTAEAARRLYPHTRAEIVYCPVSAPAEFSSREERARVRAELQTPESAVVIAQASRMEERKGHALHLEALAELKDVPAWVCWMVGGSQRTAEIEYAERLKELAARLNIAERVRFTGERRDVARLLAAADIYCQPNAGPEPFGISFVEALYAGLPVVSTALGGALEIVDQTCGVLVAPGDARAVSLALRELIEDAQRRAELGAAGPKRARLLCDPSAQLAALDEALTSLARRRAA
jgi:glycosyltransferase involved in cell wall biosynthesis